MKPKEKLHDVVDAIYRNMHSKVFVPPVQSLMDIDFYKFTMGQFIHRFYPDVEVTFKLIVRDKAIKLWKYVDLGQLQEAFEYIQSLTMRKTDIYYLRGMDLYDKYMFSEEYLTFLRSLHLSGFKIEKKDGNVEVTFTSRWCEVTFWETIGMAIISELYYRGVMKEMSEYEVHSLYAVADARLQSNLLEIKKHPTITYSDFGTRRRNSFLWQKYVVAESVRVTDRQFTGTSNVWMAFHYDLDPKGTNAHEQIQVVTALADSDEEMRQAQYKVPELWQQIYGKGLRIMLPDTYGSKQFFENAPSWLKDWTGHRQDSGDPSVEVNRYIDWLISQGENPMNRISIPSDGLTVETMVLIDNGFSGRHPTTYGWGTGGTNGFNGTVPGNDNMRSFSMVIKAYSANGRPCVKLSNDKSKATGPKDEIARYLKIFGEQDRVERPVFV